MERNFYKENGSAIKSENTAVTLKLDTTDPANIFHNLVISTNLSGIGIDAPAGTVISDNTIFVKEADAARNIFEVGSTPDLYFTAADETHIFLNVKIKINAIKTNHAGRLRHGAVDKTDKLADQV